MEVGVITNPNSRKNRGKLNRAEELQSIIGDLGEVRQTGSPEAIKPVLRDFLRRKARFWVSDGGDGALHWMLRMGQEVLQEEEFAHQNLSLPSALPTNGGSIDFVAHNVGIRGSAETILASLRRALETGQQVEEIDVDSMDIDGLEVNEAGEEVPFHTLGFAVAAGGVGQRFFEKLNQLGNHTSGNIVSVVVKTVTSYPVAYSPLRYLPGMPQLFREYAREMFKPTMARVTLDGKVLRRTDCTGIHIASMSIDLGGVLRFFKHADVPGQLHCIVGSPSPLEIVLNVPRMHLGMRMIGHDLVDGPCREMILEATTDELLAPVIDGEFYQNVRRIRFRVGPRLRIPKVVGERPLGLLQ